MHGLSDTGVCDSEAHYLDFDPSGNYDPCIEQCQFFQDARLYMPQWEYRKLLRDKQEAAATIVAKVVKPKSRRKGGDFSANPQPGRTTAGI